MWGRTGASIYIGTFETSVDVHEHSGGWECTKVWGQTGVLEGLSLLVKCFHGVLTHSNHRLVE